MEDKIVKNSEIIFGEPYRAQQNKTHEFFYCSKCRKDRRTNPIYYADRDKHQLICAECYRKMTTSGYNEAKKTAELLPEGTTLYLGKKAHHCNFEGGSDFETKYYKLINCYGKPVVLSLLHCKKCGQLIIRGNKYSPVNYLKYNVISSKQKTRENKRIQFEKRYTGPSYHPVAITEFLTRTTVKNCAVANHDIVDIQVGVKLLLKDYSIKIERVPGFYCRTCGKYYLLESEYQVLDTKGILLCNVVEQNYWSSPKKTGFYITNQESLLYKMGYNVNANSNLLPNERCAILKAALDNGLLTKAEILSHLDYLINRSVGQPALSTALEKWRHDRNYIRNINQDGSHTYYGAGTIIHRNRMKKSKS